MLYCCLYDARVPAAKRLCQLPGQSVKLSFYSYSFKFSMEIRHISLFTLQRIVNGDRKHDAPEELCKTTEKANLLVNWSDSLILKRTNIKWNKFANFRPLVSAILFKRPRFWLQISWLEIASLLAQQIWRRSLNTEAFNHLITIFVRLRCRFTNIWLQNFSKQCTFLFWVNSPES